MKFARLSALFLLSLSHHALAGDIAFLSTASEPEGNAALITNAMANDTPPDNNGWQPTPVGFDYTIYPMTSARCSDQIKAFHNFFEQNKKIVRYTSSSSCSGWDAPSDKRSYFVRLTAEAVNEGSEKAFRILVQNLQTQGILGVKYPFQKIRTVLQNRELSYTWKGAELKPFERSKHFRSLKAANSDWFEVATTIVKGTMADVSKVIKKEFGEKAHADLLRNSNEFTRIYIGTSPGFILEDGTMHRPEGGVGTWRNCKVGECTVK